MQITFRPIRGTPGSSTSVFSVSGDVLTQDGVAYDLSAVPEGGEATPSGEHFFVGPVSRVNGEIVCSVLLLLGDDAEPIQPATDAQMTLSVTSGAATPPIQMKSS